MYGRKREAEEEKEKETCCPTKFHCSEKIKLWWIKFRQAQDINTFTLEIRDGGLRDKFDAL